MCVCVCGKEGGRERAGEINRMEWSESGSLFFFYLVSQKRKLVAGYVVRASPAPQPPSFQSPSNP